MSADIKTTTRNPMFGNRARFALALLLGVTLMASAAWADRPIDDPSAAPAVGATADPASPATGPASGPPSGPMQPRPAPRLYSRAEIDAARQELDAVLADYEAALDLILENTVIQIGPDRPNVTASFISVIEESRSRLRTGWQTFNDVSAQNLPEVMAQSRPAARQLKQTLRQLRGGPFDPSLPVEPVGPISGRSGQNFMKAPTASINDCKDNDPEFDDKCFSANAAACRARDIGACVNVCATLTAAFSITAESTPDDIHVVAAGFGVNVPSPFKIGTQILKVVAKLACDIIECTADSFLSCSGGEVKRIVSEEKRYTDDFEREVQSVRIESKIDAGNGLILDEIALNASLIMALDDKLNEEERFTSDVEVNDHEANVLTALNGLEMVSCNLEQLLYVQQTKRSRLAPMCSTTAPKIGDALDIRGQSRQGKKGKKGSGGSGGDPIGETGPSGRGEGVIDVSIASETEPTGMAVDEGERSDRTAAVEPDPFDPSGVVDPEAFDRIPVLQYLGTMQIERQLLAENLVPTLYLPAERGGLIEQVRELVWETIKAQEDLNIAPDGTRLASAEARVADRHLEQRDYVEAYRDYCRAYRLLVPVAQ